MSEIAKTTDDMADTQEIEIDVDEGFVGEMVAGWSKIKNLNGCPKCGETGTFCLKKRYCDKTECSDDGWEHMHVTCEKCGFERGAKCQDFDSCCDADETPADKGAVEKVETLAAPSYLG